ncbi:MAG: hypothetical protein WD844_09495 [Thermoleophilaceae bacterium]
MSGLLIALLGAWAALVPLIGPYFDFSVRDVEAWTWDSDVLWLSILPGAVALTGGLMLAGAGSRASGGLGGWLALAGGVWLLIGSSMWLLDDVFGYANPTDSSALEQIGFFYGTGAAITALSAFALGRMSIRGHRDPGVMEERPLADVERRRHAQGTPAATDRPAGRPATGDAPATTPTRTPG